MKIIALLIAAVAMTACVDVASPSSVPPDAGDDEGRKGGHTSHELTAPDAGTAPASFLDPKGRGCSGSC